MTFGKERCNELVSHAARTSGSFDCGHFHPGDAKNYIVVIWTFSDTVLKIKAEL
jgi:hypothetical protein